jgi:uncharacterized membrane protein
VTGDTIVVLGFENPYGAEAMLDDVYKWQKQGWIEIEDAVVVCVGIGDTIDVQQTHRSEKSKFALRGGGVGLLAGALLGGPVLGLVAGVAAGVLKGRGKEKEFAGLDADFVEAASQWVRSDRSALFLLVKQADIGRLQAHLRPLKAKVLTTTLSPEQEKKLRQALAEEEYGP